MGNAVRSELSISNSFMNFPVKSHSDLCQLWVQPPAFSIKTLVLSQSSYVLFSIWSQCTMMGLDELHSWIYNLLPFSSICLGWNMVLGWPYSVRSQVPISQSFILCGYLSITTWHLGSFLSLFAAFQIWTLSQRAIPVNQEVHDFAYDYENKGRSKIIFIKELSGKSGLMSDKENNTGKKGRILIILNGINRVNITNTWAVNVGLRRLNS